MAHLGTWKTDCTRKTHRCPNTGMMLIKDVWKYPGAGLVGRSHPNQRNRDWNNPATPKPKPDAVQEESWKASLAGPLLFQSEYGKKSSDEAAPQPFTRAHTSLAIPPRAP